MRVWKNYGQTVDGSSRLITLQQSLSIFHHFFFILQFSIFLSFVFRGGFLFVYPLQIISCFLQSSNPIFRGWYIEFSSIFSFKISLVQFICIIQQFKSCFGKVFLDSCPIFCLAKNISMCLAKQTMMHLGRCSKNKAIIEQYFFFVKSSIMH